MTQKINLLVSFTIGILILLNGPLAAQHLDHVLNQALVRLVPDADLKTFQQDLQVFKGVDTKLQVLRSVSKQMNIYQLSFDHLAVNEFDFRDHIFRHPSIEIIQVNHILTKRQTIPDDPFLPTQWHWINPNDADIDMDLAWDITTGGQTANGDEIVVAVFDDGGDLNHPDLMANNWINTHEIAGNNIDDDNNGYVDDIYGWNFDLDNNNVDDGDHGVNVAGMIGAVGNNNNQGTGVNWTVKIMNVLSNSLQEDQIIEFYAYALDQRQRYTSSIGQDGAFVVATNSSWGIDGGDPNDAPLWCAFYDLLGENGILNCGATANNNVNVDVVGDLPTACPSEYMVAVTSTNSNDNRSSFAAYGATTIDIGAPGEDVYTTSANGGYSTEDGTSFASPTAAGVIALLYSAPCGNLANLAMADPKLAAELVRDFLFEGSEIVGNLAGDVVYGRINAFNSLQLIMDDCGPCPAPAGINVSNLIDVQGNFSWTNLTPTQSNSLRYRETGTGNWTELDNVSSPYLLTGLMACKEYEIQVKATCSNTVSEYSNSYVFTTDGCCVSPDDLGTTNIGDNLINLSWSPIFAAQSYNIRIREVGSPNWIETNSSDVAISFPTLTECTTYEIQIQTVCANTTTAYTESMIVNTTGCGGCTDFTYCPSTGELVSDEWIAEVILNTLNNSTPDQPASGYSDFTGGALTTSLDTNATYEIILTPGYTGSNYNEYFKVWIDYNIDGQFDEINELAFDAGGTVNETITGSITVPPGAASGITRMRVSMKYIASFDPDEPTSCFESFNYGEVEDYCITIVGPATACSPPTNLETDNIQVTSADLYWTSADNADAYSLRYKLLSEITWTEQNISSTSLTLNNLVDCKDYEYQVRSICATIQSQWSGNHNFHTDCFVGTDEVDSNTISLLELFPNPFTDEVNTRFNLSENIALTMEVFTATGSLLSQSQYQLSVGQQHIAVPGLEGVPPGIYIIALTTEKGKIVRKVVKQ